MYQCTQQCTLYSELKLLNSEFKLLDTQKAFPRTNIPPKQLKEVVDIVAEPLQKIWNEEILTKRTFPSKLKRADVIPLHKKMETIFEGNYRPVSILAVVSKIFERIMDKQTNSFMENKLSKFLCGYRKCYSPQHALLVMVEKWKESIDVYRVDLQLVFLWIFQRLLSIMQ